MTSQFSKPTNGDRGEVVALGDCQPGLGQRRAAAIAVALV
jgi:hypothetical protein